MALERQPSSIARMIAEMGSMIPVTTETDAEARLHPTSEPTVAGNQKQTA